MKQVFNFTAVIFLVVVWVGMAEGQDSLQYEYVSSFNLGSLVYADENYLISEISYMDSLWNGAWYHRLLVFDNSNPPAPSQIWSGFDLEFMRGIDQFSSSESFHNATIVNDSVLLDVSVRHLTSDVGQGVNAEIRTLNLSSGETLWSEKYEWSSEGGRDALNYLLPDEIISHEGLLHLNMGVFGIKCFDFSDPEAPTEVFHIEEACAGMSLADDRLIYCTNEQNGEGDFHYLVTVNLADPTNPQEMTRTRMSPNFGCFSQQTYFLNTAFIADKLFLPYYPIVYQNSSDSVITVEFSLREDGQLDSIAAIDSTSPGSLSAFDGKLFIPNIRSLTGRPYSPWRFVGFTEFSFDDHDDLIPSRSYTDTSAWGMNVVAKVDDWLYLNVGRWEGSSIDLLHLGPVAVSEDRYKTPSGFQLLSPYPNPFNSSVVIPFELPITTEVGLSVFSADGRLVESKSLGFMSAGQRSYVWNATGVTSGVYFIRLDGAQTERMSSVRLIR